MCGEGPALSILAQASPHGPLEAKFCLGSKFKHYYFKNVNVIHFLIHLDTLQFIPFLQPLNAPAWREKPVLSVSAYFSTSLPTQCVFRPFFFFFFWLGVEESCTHSIQKFPGQRSNICHSSENTRSSTARPPGNSFFFFFFFF